MKEESEKYILKVNEPILTGAMHLDKILMHMANNDGSDTYFLTNDPVWMSIQGKKRLVLDRKLGRKEMESIITHITDTSASIGKLGKGEQVNHAYEIKEKETINNKIVTKRFRFRVNAVTTTKSGSTGMSITVRTIPTTPPLVSTLGVEDSIIEVFKKSKQGLILVSGATGSGKSTLLASLIRECLACPDGHHHLVTIESPVEFVFDDVPKPSSLVSQIQVDQGVACFADGVINSLRMAPTMIEIGETRDKETAQAAIDASNTGHLVMTTLHSNTAAATVERYVSLFSTDSERRKAKIDLINETKLIISQALVPTVDGKRTAIKEYIILNKEIRDFLYEDLELMTKRMGEAVQRWGHPMSKDIKAKLDAGLISKEQADRLLYNYE